MKQHLFTGGQINSMRGRTKFWFFLLTGLFLIGAAGVYYVYNKPHRDVAGEKTIPVTATDLFNAFHQNEAAANAAYLDKAIEVTGEVAEVKVNQEGKTVIVLKSQDPFYGVLCTLKDKTNTSHPGQQVKIKGLCSGFNADVVLRDCILQI